MESEINQIINFLMKKGEVAKAARVRKLAEDLKLKEYEIACLRQDFEKNGGGKLWG